MQKSEQTEFMKQKNNYALQNVVQFKRFFYTAQQDQQGAKLPTAKSLSLYYNITVFTSMVFKLSLFPLMSVYSTLTN